MDNFGKQTKVRCCYHGNRILKHVRDDMLDIIQHILIW